MTRGYFGIGVYHIKTEVNIGTLWRSAYQLGAAHVFTIGRRYKKQSSDTYATSKHLPLFHYSDYDDFYSHIPHECRVVGVEMCGRPIEIFAHLEQCVYLLGAEDGGLPDDIIERCAYTIALPSVRQPSFNVAVAGSIVMYDRLVKDRSTSHATMRISPEWET